MRRTLTLCLLLCLWPASAHAGLLTITTRPAPAILAGDGSLSLTADLATISGSQTPLHPAQIFPTVGGTVTLQLGPSVAGTLDTGLTWSTGSITVFGNGHVLDSETLGRTVLAPRTDLAGLPFFAFDATPFSSTLAPELAAFFGVFANGSSLLGGNFRVVDGVLTAPQGIQAGGIVFDLPPGSVPEPGSLVLLALGLAAAAIRAPRPRRPR